MSKDDTLSDVLSRHKMIFDKRMGTIKGFNTDIKLQDGAKPIFCKACPHPYALSQKVEKELDRLEKLASPIVRVPKKDRGLPICGDLKLSVNQVLVDNPYPLPDMEDVFATLGSRTMFSKIEFSNAYQQLELNTSSQQYLTVNIHEGFFASQLLTNGIAPLPALF